MSKDADGELFTYWPLSGLVEGEDSEVLEFIEDTPIEGELRATSDPRVIVWAREKDTGSYQNISTTPIDLSGFAGPETEFQLYLEAVGPIPDGSELVTIYVTASDASPAGWTL